MNQIYLGQRAYGFASAARVYFGKDLKDITLAEAAMLAGLPKAPSAYNPVVNPKRAKVRQQYILQRMLRTALHHAGTIRRGGEAAARREGRRASEFSVHAEYVAEMVRQMMYAQYREEAYTRGLNVVTTIDSADQDAAYRALRKGLMDYERRHVYRGPEAFIDLPVRRRRPRAGDRRRAASSIPTTAKSSRRWSRRRARSRCRRRFIDGNVATIDGDGLRFARVALGTRAQPNQRIRPGAIIRAREGRRRRLDRSRSCRRWKARSSRSCRRTARSARWSAASTSTRTSSTTSRRRGASRARASSRSSIRRRSKRA